MSTANATESADRDCRAVFVGALPGIEKVARYRFRCVRCPDRRPLLDLAAEEEFAEDYAAFCGCCGMRAHTDSSIPCPLF